MKWNMISTGDIALRKGGSVDPKKHQDEVFELYSIPAFDAGAPEVVAGSAIGSSKKAVQPNDVMISRIVPHIRRACVVGPAKGHRQIASGEWIIFRDERIWPKYLRWQLVGDVFHSAFMRTVSGVGGSLLRARPAEVFKVEIPLPPLAEQKRIARILDAADALRAKRREALAQLDTLLQSTFLDMFGDPVTNPMGWEKPPLEDLCEKVIDCPHSTPRWSGSGVICLRTSNLGKGEWNWADTRFVIEEDYTERTRRSEILPNDIILSREGTVGVLALVDEGMRLCMGQRLVQLRVNDSQLDPRFLLNLLLHDLAPERLSRLIAGSTSKHLNVKELRKLPVLLPPLDLQRRFAVIVASVEQQKAGQRAHLDELDTLFASLQSRAFRGEL